MTNPKTISPTCLSAVRVRPGHGFCCGRAATTETAEPDATSSCTCVTGRRAVSVIVEDPVLGDDEVEGGHHADDRQEEPRHRGRVPHVERPEPALVEVE